MSTNVAVVGCGYWGKNLVRVFSELGHLAAVSDLDPKLAATMAEKYSVPALPLDDVLASQEIDAVAVATPAATHATIAGLSLRAGKHTFVEKPIALQSADAAELVAVADHEGLTLMVGHLLHYHPAFVRLRELVREGRLGRLQYIYSNRLNLGKIRREENVFWSFAPHDISMILSLAGEMPDTVRAVGANYLHAAIADVTNTYLSFPNGINAHIFVSWLHPFKDQKLVVVGSEGMAVFDDTKDWDEKLCLYDHRISWREGSPEPEKADAEMIELETAEPLAVECTHFVDCVRDGARPKTDGHEGLRVLRVLEAAGQDLLGDPGSGGPHAGKAPARFPGAQVHESAYVDDGCAIGEGTKIWHFSHVLSESVIGTDCVIGQNVMVGPRVRIGDRCKIQNNVSVYPGVTLEEGVFCGPSCVFTNVINPRAEVERKEEFRDTLVGRGATIGANATIVCGNDLGEYSFVAAGAVVTADVPPYALVAGVPAKRIGWMSAAGEKLGEDLVCPRSGQGYEETADGRLIPSETR